MATTTFQKIVTNLSNNKSIQNLLENFQKLNDEIKKKETDLKNAFDQQKDEKIELAWKKYQEIVKVLGSSEAKLEKEVNGTLKKIRKSATDLEKNIAAYKKKALVQKAKFEKTLFKKTTKKTAAKKVTAKAKTSVKKAVAKATKAVSKKTAKKTTKKKSK